MTATTIKDSFKCSVNDFYKIITDYEKYPEFLSEISVCRIIEEKAEQGQIKKLVEYHIRLFKSFMYRLWMIENHQDCSLNWEFAQGSIFKSNQGYWKLKGQKDQCVATFYIDCQFKIFIPSTVSKKLISIHLPNMMRSYHQRVGVLYG